MAFSPEAVLGIAPESSSDVVDAAYSQRLRETDPARVRDMDRRIRATTERCRREVELAYRMLTAPEQVDPAEVRRHEAAAAKAADADGDPDTPDPKSYWRAVVLTMVLPGAGSWYAGGRLRGLIVIGLFTLAVVWVMQAVMGDVQAAASASPMGKLMALQASWSTHSGLTYGAFGLALADALVAVWAHNDRLADGGTQAPAASASASADSSSAP